MSEPVLDPRSLEDVRGQLAALAASYTPEWRYEGAGDDPGAALAELFSAMFHQTVERFNALPSKLYIEFLNLIGYREPPPSPARGTMVFDPDNTVSEPVAVPAGTQVFAPDEQGENIVFETQWSMEATPAKLLDVYFADAGADTIRRLDRSRPQPFFTPVGEELQRHRMALSHHEALRLDCPAAITLEFLDGMGRPAPDLAEALGAEGLRWSYRRGEEEAPFDAVKARPGVLTLEKRDSRPISPDPSGRLCISCQGTPEREITLEQVLLKSEPLSPCPVQTMFADDMPISPEEGGYCFSRQPAPYNFFYLRCDTALCKRGARVNLSLDLAPVTVEPPAQEIVYQYDRHIIDKEGAVEARPDDVVVTGVMWEYFNGSGWRRLTVTGDKNPFSCQHAGALNTIFHVPEDLEPIEVNAEDGYYIRARVTEVQNQFSQYPRWILPFVKGAAFQWQYEEGVRADYLVGENHGDVAEIIGSGQMRHLRFPALSPMKPGPKRMYFRFDRSPHASPLSLRFQVCGGGATEELLQWEGWNGKAFEPVRGMDQTARLGHSGEMLLFLPERLPERTLFGQEGCWLRLSRTSDRAGPVPVVGDIRPNAVIAVQCQQGPEQYFDTGIFEAGKTLQLLETPVQRCEVWVDELQSLSRQEAERLQREQLDHVRPEREGNELVRLWVRWTRMPDLALAEADARGYMLDPYEGVVQFGDGARGRVPPAGERNILVRYTSGGGPRGNLPQGAVNALLGGLPLIADVGNITPMSGGMGRLTRREIEERGNRLLRHRGRAVGCRDYEDIVREAFPQVRHVRCFAGVAGSGCRAPGHVTVVLRGFGGAADEVQLREQVAAYLKTKCSCCLVAEGRLHVRTAELLTVNTQVIVTVERPELASDTQQEIARRLTRLVTQVWKGRSIGAQIRLDEVWQVVRQAPNVDLVDRILVECAFTRDGVDQLAPLEADDAFPFGVVESGRHQVHVR